MIDVLLDPQELRVLGCLIEKGITTPDYYPMTLNALTTACNQKSSRDPVVQYDEKTVVRALDSLREKKLTRVVSGADMRVSKYHHCFNEQTGFNAAEVAILCELMLRGPQTVGELRSRCSRMFCFDDLTAVESSLSDLMNRAAGEAVIKLPRQPGLKEARFAHLLGEPSEIEVSEEADQDGPRLLRPEPVRVAMDAENERLDCLEATVHELRLEIATLRTQLEEFKRQFE